MSQYKIDIYATGPVPCLPLHCRRKHGRFLVSTISSVTISNPDALPSSEKGVNPGINNGKGTCLLIEPNVKKPNWLSLFRIGVKRLHNLLWIWNSPGSKAVYPNAFSGWMARFFLVMMGDFLREGVKKYRNAQMSPLHSSKKKQFLSPHPSLCLVLPDAYNSRRELQIQNI
jgi:hypothetical protein